MFSAELASCPHISYNTDTLPQTTFNARSNILNTIFKTKHNIVTSFTQTVKYLSNDRYRISVSIIDDYTSRNDLQIHHVRSSSEYIYNHLVPCDDDSKFTLQSYTDERIVVYTSSIPVNNVTFRQHINTKRCEKELVVHNIASFTPKTDAFRDAGNIYVNGCNFRSILSTSSKDNSVFYTPIVLKLSKFDTIPSSDLKLPVAYAIRQQTCIYTFRDTAMSAWNISKVVRFLSADVDDNKLTSPLHIDNVTHPNVYDALSLQFNYIGDFNDIEEHLFRLLEFIYVDYNNFSVPYNVISSIVNVKLASLMNNVTIISKNDLYARNINDLVLTYNVEGTRCLLICYNSDVYELSSTSFGIVASDINYLNISSIVLNVLSFHKHNPRSINRLPHDAMPSITVFECSKDENGIYHVFDIHFFDTYNLTSMKYVSKLNMLHHVIPMFNDMFEKKVVLNMVSVVNTPTLKNTSITLKGSVTSTAQIWKLLSPKFEEYSSHGIVARVINPLNETEYNHCLLVKSNSDYTIRFHVMYDVDKRCFLLYTIGNVSNIVKHFALYNKFTDRHFGSSTIQNAKSNTNNILFANPYYNLYVKRNSTNAHVDSYMFIPREKFETRSISKDKLPSIVKLMSDMSSDPNKYHNSLIKFTLVEDGWIPVKMLNSTSVLPDSYIEALHVLSTIYESLDTKRSGSIPETQHEISNLHFVTKQYQSLLNVYLSVNELIHLYIIEKFMTSSMYTMIDIIDKESVNGNIIQSISHINNIYLISNEYRLITKYISSLANKTNKRHLFNQLETFGQTWDDTVVNVNVVNSSFTFDDNGILNSMNISSEYKIHSINVIFIQKFDDIFKSVINLLSFINFCINTLTSNGSIVFKHFDIDEIRYIVSHKIDTFGLKYIPVETLIDTTIPEFDKEYDNWDDDTLPTVENMLSDYMSNDRDKRGATIGDVDVKVSGKRLTYSFSATMGDGRVFDEKIKIRPSSIQSLEAAKFPRNVLYYYVHGLYDNGKFKSTRLISNIARYNLQLVLNLNVELYSNMYEHQYDYWYSEHHDVDSIFGSIDNSSAALDSNINDNLLIERDTLSQECMDYISTNRRTSKFSTVIITKSEISEKCVHKFMSPDGQTVNVYVIYPGWMRTNDRSIHKLSVMMDIIDEQVRASIASTQPIIEFIQYVDIIDHDVRSNANTYLVHPVLNKLMMGILNNWFNGLKTIKPLKEYELTKHITSNVLYSNIKLVDPLMRCLNFSKMTLQPFDEYADNE